MSSADKFDPFSFLTIRRQHMFWQAIGATNRRHQASLASSGHVYEHLSSRGKAFDAREWCIAHIMEAFDDDGGANRRDVNNISGIEFDNRYFVYFQLITDPTQAVAVPKTLIKARQQSEQKAKQQLLPDDFFIPENSDGETPLSELYPILAGYIRYEGLITALHFLDQDGTTIHNSRELDATYSSLRQQREVRRPPKPSFSLKSNQIKKREAYLRNNEPDRQL